MLVGMLLAKIVTRGHLVLIDSRGRRHEIGDDSPPRVVLRSRDKRTHDATRVAKGREDNEMPEVDAVGDHPEPDQRTEREEAREKTRLESGANKEHGRE